MSEAAGHIPISIAQRTSTSRPDAKGIFGEALQFTDRAQRQSYVDSACGDDQQLRQEVESLLSAHERTADFFGKLTHLSVPVLPTEHTGVMIGRYQLLQQIGEGGFGTVWMAKQLEPVQRKVALKIIKPGMDTNEVIARFGIEQQALALMDHPNIARVLDAGMTQAGRPYFVMELIDGLPITQYCDRERLSTTDRLRLFLQVCHAVQHAHQKGIIHRDLKPSNVLVKLQDGKPSPKVIDFGVAKALGQKLTEKTLATAYHQLIGTPAYMSPEQAELSGLDVDTRSDIYSLGVMLYELLTGFTPVDGEAMGKAGLEQIRRIICEVEPLKPSTRLTRLAPSQLAALAARRKVEPAKLRRLLRGDLDWIVMKALEKEQNRRYQAATALILDLEHHLQDEPITAAAPTLAYRAGKFIRRHGAALTVSIIIVSILGLGGGVAYRLRTRITEAESAKFKLRAFMKDSIEQRVRAALSIDSAFERLKAFQEIRENMPDEAFEVLIASLNSEDEKVRRRVGSVLSVFRAFIPKKAETLADQLLHNPDPQVRKACAGVLMPVESQVVDRAYAKAVFDSYEDVACLSCGQLGWRPNTEGTEALFQVLTNRSWHVRFNACAALVKQKTADRRVVATLEALAREPEAIEEDRRSLEMATNEVWKSLLGSAGSEDTALWTVERFLERARTLANSHK